MCGCMFMSNDENHFLHFVAKLFAFSKSHYSRHYLTHIYATILSSFLSLMERRTFVGNALITIELEVRADI